jgi:hypothetical protein
MRLAAPFLFAFLITGGLSHGAATGVESFASGAQGWMGSSSFFSGTWSFTGGAARVKFMNLGDFPFPDTGTISNMPSASSGSFTGNYDLAGISVIGFRIMAPNVPPSGLVILEWGGSTSIYQQGFTINSTGVWVTCTASIADDAIAFWSPIEGSMDDFSAARQSVRFVSIRITRTGTLAHEFVVDDIFLAGQPSITTISTSNGTNFTLTGEGMVSNLFYHVESAATVGCTT